MLIGRKGRKKRHRMISRKGAKARTIGKAVISTEGRNISEIPRLHSG